MGRVALVLRRIRRPLLPRAMTRTLPAKMRFGPTSPSGTAFARSCSSTESRSRSSPAAASRWSATSPSCNSPPPAGTCSTVRSSSKTSRGPALRRALPGGSPGGLAHRRLALETETPRTSSPSDLLASGRLEPAGAPVRAAPALQLEALAARIRGPTRPPTARPPSLTPCGEAEPWLRSGEASWPRRPYRPGERDRHGQGQARADDRLRGDGLAAGKEPGTVGSLILGLYDEGGQLRVVGHSSGFTARHKREMVAELARSRPASRGSGEPSRWNRRARLEWIRGCAPSWSWRSPSTTPATAASVRAKGPRWRDDKPRSECGMAQLWSIRHGGREGDMARRLTPAVRGATARI